MGTASVPSWKIEFDATGSGFRWGRLGDDFVAEWHGVLQLRAGPRGNVKEMTPVQGAPVGAVEKVRVGAAQAFLRAIAGEPTLHASAVSLGGPAVLCVGPSGVGKSTVAEQLCQKFQGELLADDVAALDLLDARWRVLPSEHRLWLHATDAGTDVKEPIVVCAATEAKEVGLIVALSFDDSLGAPSATRTTGATVGAALLEASLRLEVTPQHLRQELDVADGLAAQARVYSVARPHGSSPESVACLVAQLAAREEPWRL